MSQRIEELEPSRAERLVRQVMLRIDAYEAAQAKRRLWLGWAAPALAFGMLLATAMVPLPQGQPTATQAGVQASLPLPHEDAVRLFAEEFGGNL